MTSDLAAWLTAVWDEEERLAFDRRARVHAMTCDGFPSDETESGYAEAGEVDNCTCGGPGHALARIAADRKILALHAAEWRQRPDHEIGDSDDPWCGACLDEAYPCPTACLLAGPYKDRPGFRSEWLVERQGVEQ